MSILADKKCAPCEGGVAPLSPARAKTMLKKLHRDWKLAPMKQFWAAYSLGSLGSG